jgi:hypothetical protein
MMSISVVYMAELEPFFVKSGKKGDIYGRQQDLRGENARAQSF